MRGKITMMLMTLTLMSCSKEGKVSAGRDLDYDYGKDLSHDAIVLGDRLENPYKTENITKALESLYPTKADRVDVKTTDLYVRFLPADEQEYDELVALGLHLTDHPLDYDILVEGDWYHDPEIAEGNVTWQYAVVPPDFEFPEIRHEIIDECYISENDAGTRAEGIDWEAVEREAFRLTGNGDMLSSVATKAPGKTVPSGRITIVDDKFNGGKPVGVAGVRVSCNTFVKFDDAYTDEDGYYEMNKKFSANLRYRLVFKNEKGFAIGVNLVLVPASVSTLGKASPEGVSMTVTEKSEDKLFKRCVVNNAVYDYIGRCNENDMDISTPPSDLRIWLFHNLRSSSAVMLHHGAVVDNDLFRKFLGDFAPLVKFLLPDITIGTKDDSTYADLYSSTCHELAHASHFAKVGRDYWEEYIFYILESFVTSGGVTYGDGTGERAGYCEVGEMWAYYLESMMYKDRYGGDFPTFGNSFWFKPQIFRYLDERGMSCQDFFSVLDSDTDSKDELENALIKAFPAKKSVIDQAFDRY
ncbi:MAG: hypothetical protein IJ394_01625 [Bacteroidales bacterium]|nr:hypothetical protein [Bacteroidales bacterium]